MNQRWRGCSLYVILLLILAPMLVFAVQAFAERWFFPALIPREWTFSAFLRQINNPDMVAALGQTLVIATGVSVLSVIIGYPAARALELHLPNAKRWLYALLFLPTVVPSVATGIGLNIVFLRLNLAGTLIGVMLVHLIPVLPYTILTLGSVLGRYDQGYEQQARVLGANGWQIWWRVTLRLIAPGMMVTLFLAFLISWSQYVLTLLIGGGRIITLPMLLFATVSGGNPTSIAVQSLIFITPLVVLIAFIGRYLVGDVEAGDRESHPKGTRGSRNVL